MNPKTYTSLEPAFSQTFTQNGQAVGFSTDAAVSLFASTSFLYTLGIMLSVVAAGVMYARAGVYRMQASEKGVRKSNEEIKRTTLGLLGVLSLFVIIYTFNRDLLTGDVTLGELRAGTAAPSGGLSTVVPSTYTPPSNTASRTCDAPTYVISQLSSPNGICANTSCTVLSGCAYQQYLPIIRSEASRQGVDENLVIAIMCTESRGLATAKNQNPNGSYDCGLMQINRTGTCDPSSFDPASNIAAGVAHLKRVIASAGQIYQNIPQTAGIAATYNCCANGTVPNAPSADCTPSAGFPFTIPKWACPINPGEGQYNMCTVKSYGCGVTACVRQLSGGGM
jgi:hypothetical protein